MADDENERCRENENKFNNLQLDFDNLQEAFSELVEARKDHLNIIVDYGKHIESLEKKISIAEAYEFHKRLEKLENKLCMRITEIFTNEEIKKIRDNLKEQLEENGETSEEIQD